MTGWIGWCWRKLHIRKWWRSWWCSVGSYHQVGEIIGDHIHLEAWFVCHTWYVLKDSYNTPSAGLFRRSISASRFQGWVSLQWSDIFELRFFWPAKDDFACISELRAHIYRVTGGVIKTGRMCVSQRLRGQLVFDVLVNTFLQYLWSDRESELVAVFCPIMLHCRQFLFFWNRLKIWMRCERNTV